MDDNEELSEELGLLAAFAIGVGVMVCAGIFMLPAAAATAGPAAAAFALAGFIAAFTALSISELGTAMPKAGGAYYYINDALGPLFGSVAGWGNWIGLSAAVGFYLVGLGSYAAIFLPVPPVTILGYGLAPSQVIALFAGLFFFTLNIIGTEETGKVQIAIVGSISSGANSGWIRSTSSIATTSIGASIATRTHTLMRSISTRRPTPRQLMPNRPVSA